MRATLKIVDQEGNAVHLHTDIDEASYLDAEAEGLGTLYLGDKAFWGGLWDARSITVNGIDISTSI